MNSTNQHPQSEQAPTVIKRPRSRSATAVRTAIASVISVAALTLSVAVSSPASASSCTPATYGCELLGGSSWAPASVSSNFNDLNVYSNGSNYDSQPYQCTELALRWAHDAWGEPSSWPHWPSGKASDMWTAASYLTNPLQWVRNGSQQRPQPGDLLLFSDNGPGHVVVVTAVANGNVYFVGQNQYPFGATASVPISANNLVSVGNFYSPNMNASVEGWLHNPKWNWSTTPQHSGADDVLVNGNFRGTTAPWLAQAGANLVVVSGSPYGTTPYDGTSYAATNAPQPGGAIYEQIPLAISAGQDYCASLQVVTQGSATGGSGTLAVSLMGGTATDATNTALTGLGNGSNWKGFTGCVTATGTHTSLVVAIYPTVGGPTLAIDAIQAS